MERQIIGIIEHYDSIIKGKCKCGQLFTKVIGSNCTMWVNGDRYHYPEDDKPVCVFRCKVCGNPIHKSFEALEKED